MLFNLKYIILNTGSHTKLHEKGIKHVQLNFFNSLTEASHRHNN